MKKLCAFLTFLLILIIVSCEIGLGSSVDTDPPTININIPNPETVAVIRGSFPIMGTYEDDGSIASINIVVSTAASNSQVVLEKKAEVIKDPDSPRKGRWKLIIDPKVEADNISDGAYQISVTAKDNAGRTSLQTSQIRIDNTPPLIVLQRPSTVFDAAVPDAYGQTFSLIGQSMDDNGVNLEMEIYSDSDFTDVSPVIIKKEGIPETINLDFAKKGDDKYSSIYFKGDLNRTGTLNSYFKLISYDNAVAYQPDGTQTLEDRSLGNKSDIYYLYDDISDLISEYNIKEIYRIIEEATHSQTENRSINNSGNDVIQTLFDSNIIRNKGSFSLCPNNNPTYTITGRSQLPDSEAEYSEFFSNSDISSLTVGGSLQVEIKPGLDETPLVLDSLIPYAYVYDNETGKGIEKIIPDILSTKKNGSIYKIEVEISKEKFTPGKNYILGVDGKDKDERPVEPDGNGYGFHCSSNGEGPVIKITNPTEDELSQYNNIIYKKLGDSFEIAGTVEYENKGEFDILLDNVSLFGSNGSVNIDNLTNLPEGLVFASSTQQTYNKKYSFSYIIPKEAFSQTETASYAIAVKATADRISVQKSVRCIYDAKAPEAKILSISPIAAKYVNNKHTFGLSPEVGSYLNGTVVLKTSVYEEINGSGVNENETYLEYSEEIGQTAVWKNISDIKIKTKTNEEQLDTSKLCNGSDEKKIYFRINSKDYAGNVSSGNISGPYFINQKTDIPVILAGREWVKIYETEPEDGIYDSSFSENLLRYRKIYFTLIDDDGLQSIAVEAQKKQGNEFIDITGEPVNQPDGTKKNLNFYYTSSEFESAGVYKLKLTVKDKLNNKATLTTYFKITSNAPKISDVKLENTYITTNTTNVVSNPIDTIQANLKITSTEAPFVITYQITKDDTVIQAFDVVKKQNVQLSQNSIYAIEIEPSDSWPTGLYNIQLKVTDKNGISDIQNGTKIFNIDNERPVVSSIAIPNADGTETEDEYFDFEITASDTAGSSSIPVKYWIAFAQCDDDAGTNPQNKTVWLDATEFKAYNLRFAQFNNDNQPFKNSGYKLVYSKVEDAVGNISEEKSEVFVYDTASPAVTINGDATFYTNARFNLNGITTDDWEIKKLTLKQTQKKIDETLTADSVEITDSISANGNWEKSGLPLDNGTLENGTYIYTVEAEDKVGKKTTSSTVTVEIDQIAPVIVWETPQSNVYSGLTALSGRATDVGLGVQTLLHKIVRQDASSAPESYYETSLSLSNNTPWRLSLDTKVGTKESGSDILYSTEENKYTLYEGDYKLYVKAKDRAGNITADEAMLVYSFSVDQEAPKITAISLYDNPLYADADTINYYKGKETASENIITGEIVETKELDATNCTAKLIDNSTEPATETPVTISITQTQVQAAEGKYSFVISDFVKELQKDKTVELSITLKDKAAKELTYKYKLHNDNTVPAIVFLNPDKDMQGEESLSGEKYNFRATAGDSGCGMGSLKYLILKASNENDTGLSDEDVKVHSDLTATTLPTSLNIEKLLKAKENSTESYLTEGKWFIYLYAKDKVGNEKVEKRTIWIDQNNPELNVNPIEKTGQNVNGVPVRNAGFTLSGTAKDENNIKENGIEIKDGDTVYKLNTSGEAGYWSKEFTLGTGEGKLSEGTHNLIITAIDNAGKKTSVTKSVIIDTVKPAGSFTIDSTPKEDWYDSQYIKITVTPSDTAPSSGIFKVEARAESTSDTETPSWTVLTRQETAGIVTYSGSVLCKEQGLNTIKVKVTDNAGNDNTGENGTVISKQVTIDTMKPDFAQLFSVDSDETPAALTGKKYVNGRNPLTIVLDAKDSGETENKGSGIKSVSLIKPLKNLENGVTGIPATLNRTTKHWEVTIPKENIDTGALSFAITDNVDLTYNYTSDLSITCDDIAPEVKSINLPEDADKTNAGGTHSAGVDVNGTITLSGLVGDNRVVSQVDVSYYIDIEGKRDWTPCFQQKSKEDWEFNLDTKTVFENIPDGTPVYLAVVVMDDVGNCNLDTKTGGTVTKNHESKDGTTYNVPKSGKTPADIATANKAVFYINQNSDRPVITLDDLNFEGMSASNYFMYGSNTISGTIDDDDGDVQAVWYNLDDKTENGNTKWEPLPLNNSSFMISNLPDNSHKILFKVQDKLDGEFVTTADTSANANLMTIPVVTDGTKYLAKTSKEDTTIYVATDDNPPIVSDDVEIKILNPTDHSQEQFVLYSGLQSVGGTSFNQFCLKASAWDSNKIAKIIFTLDKDPNDPESITDEILTKVIENTNYEDDAFDSAKNAYRFDVELSGENAFNVQNMKSGIRGLTVTAVDKAGKTAETKKMLKIINEPPAIRVVSHSEGDQEGSVFLLKAVVEGNENTIFRYQITRQNELPDASKWSAPIPYAVSTRNMEINPRDVVLSFVNYIKVDPKTGLVVYKEVVNGHEIGDRYKDLNLYTVHFYAKDEFGNVNDTTAISLKLDPQGDIPVIKLTSPMKDSEEPDEYDALLSGIVRIAGTVTAKNPIEGIYLQIDPQYNKANGFNDNWLTTPLPNAVDTSISGKTIDEIKDYLEYEIEEIGNSGRYGIKIGTDTNWNFAFNKKSEFEKLTTINGKTEYDNNTIAIRLFAYDGANITDSENDIFVINLDAGAPRIGSSEPLYLRRYGWKDGDGNIYYTSTPDSSAGAALYEDAGCNTPAGKSLDSSYTYTPFVKQYEKDMWLEGEWWLTASIEDESGISSIIIKDEAISESELQNNKTYWDANGVQVAASAKKTEGYILNYKIGSKQEDAHGTLTYKITASDNDAKSTTANVSIKYDNKKPRLEQYNLTTQNVYNKDGFYRVQSGAIEDDDESGFKMAVFFFKRNIPGYKYVYDTYRAYTEKNDQGNVISHKANALSYDGSDSSVPLVIQGEEGLWWKAANYIEINGSNITLNEAEKFAHAGGLAKLDGSIYRISAVNDTTVTLEGIPSANSTGSILFAIGHVVDKEGSESEGSSRSDIITEDDCYGYYAHLIDDDGDKMIESVTPSDTSTIWSGAINSNNIPDGPIELHYVVFDKAGNYKSGLVEGLNVSNNAPRLAGLKVVSGLEEDIFYNGDYEVKLGANNYKHRATKLENNCLVVSGNKKGPSDGGSAFMTVKDSIKFYPEIVGGNGNLYYSYKAGEDLTAPVASGNSGEYSFAQGWNDGIDDYLDDTGYYRKDLEGTEYYEGHYTGYAEFTTNLIEDKLHNSTVKPTWFEYTIWDSTAGTTKFVDSLNVSFQCALWIEYFDDVDPVLDDVTPLYWTSESDNSLYKHSRKQGHIELKADISDALKGEDYGFGAYDLVSGKITMKGTASDNIRVSKIYAKVISPYESDTFLKNYTVIAEYNRNDNNEMEWQSSSRGIDVDGWECKVTNDTSVAEGHKVNWEFSWDTEKLLRGAEKGVTLSFKVEDEWRGGKANRSGKKADGTFEDKTYTVDVVPYISHVKTSLSSALSNNPTVYDRTTWGHYPVYLGESVTLEGFNLKDQTSLNVSTSSLTLEEDTRTHSNSATYSVTVNHIDNINGLNNNALPYNMQKNGVNNDLLTDDLVFDVWKINSNVASPNTDIKNSGKTLSQPIMHIHPTEGFLGFAFVDGSFAAAMANGKTKSYETWIRSRDLCTSINFVYDDLGNSYGTIAGGDVDDKDNDSSCLDKFNFVTSIWGTSGTGDTYGTSKGKDLKALRLESVGSGFNGSLVFEKQRIQSPSIITSTHNSNTNVYLAYYDNVNGQIRFRAGIIDTTSKTISSTGYGNLVDSESNRQNSFDGRKFPTDAFEIKDKNHVYVKATGKKAVWEDVISSWEPTFQILADGTMPTGKAGSYVSLSVIPGDTETTDTLIAVWYSSDGILWYSYNNSPITERHNTSRVDDTTTDDGWSTPVRVFENNAIFKSPGMYCKVAVDAQKGVHIAGFDPVTRTLDYAYLNKDYAGAATSQDNFKTMVVDANGIAGKYLTLDVAMETSSSNVGTPYIGYYSDSCQRPKMAYLLNPEGLTNAAIPGSNGKLVTGAWEITAVPTPNKAKLQSDLYNAINIGVWKDSGVIKASTTGTEDGKVYGNGSKNPVLGYAITAETIETAQKMGQ